MKKTILLKIKNKILPSLILRTGDYSVRGGFTLIEVLVVMFILMLILVGSLGIYTYSIKAQRKTIDITLVSQDIQFLMTTLSRNIRASDIDYDFYGRSVPIIELETTDTPPVPKALNELALYNPATGKGMVYKQIDSQAMVCFCGGRCDAASECTEDNDFVGITTTRMKITQGGDTLAVGSSGLKFFIVPASAPFGETDPAKIIQPRVTISLNADGAGENLTVQQTIPQRFFERR